MSGTYADEHGNLHAREGVDRCACGAKYWERDVCASCGAPFPRLRATLYGGAYRGTPSRPNANPVLDAMRDDDMGDPWGTAMAWGFAVCDYLYHVALDPDAIPAEMGYGPAATVVGEGFDDESWPDGYLVEMGLDTYTLNMAARCLNRYLDWCKAAGRDY